MRRIVRVAGIALLLLGIAVLVSLIWIDGIGRAAVESGGEQAMGVTTTLDDLDLSLFGGTCGLKGLTVGNPKGFPAPHFLALEKGEIAVTLGSLLGDTVEVPRIVLEGIDLNLEKTRDGANYEVILAHMQRGETTEETGRRFVVGEAVLRSIRVHVDVAVGGRKLSRVDLEIPEIRVENLSSEDDAGLVLSRLTGTLVKATLLAVAKQGPRVIPEAVVNGLGAGLEGMGDVGRLGVRVVGAITGTVGGKPVKVVGGVLKEVGGVLGEGAGEVLEGIGGLLGGGKDEEEEKKD